MFSRIASGHHHLRSTGNDLRLTIASHLSTAVCGEQFRKEWRKLQTRIMLERYYSFFHYCPLSYRFVMFQKRFLYKPKWGAQIVVRGALPPRSDGTEREQAANMMSGGAPEKRSCSSFSFLIAHRFSIYQTGHASRTLRCLIGILVTMYQSMKNHPDITTSLLDSMQDSGWVSSTFSQSRVFFLCFWCII